MSFLSAHRVAIFTGHPTNCLSIYHFLNYPTREDKKNRMNISLNDPGERAIFLGYTHIRELDHFVTVVKAKRIALKLN